jgi:hypothetical protein
MVSIHLVSLAVVMARDTMHVQPSWLDVQEAKVHYDAGANPRSKTTWQQH